MQQIHIELYRDANVFVTDAYDRLISKIPVLKETKGYKLFTISGCEPSVGTTTIAINIATSLAISKRSTLLVDTDIRKGHRGKRLNEGVECGLSDYLLGKVELSEALCKTNFEHMHYISCGKAIENPVMLLNSKQFEVFIDKISSQYEYVIFDSPTLNATVDAGIIAAKTSGVILVAAYMQTRMAQIRSAKRELEQLEANIIGVLLNNVPKNRYKRYVENYDYFAEKAFEKQKRRNKEREKEEVAAGRRKKSGEDAK